MRGVIAWEQALRTARKLLGTPYAEMDCIALIRAVIRQAEGGAKDYRCEGTNWLWRSIGNAEKYRHLTWRQESAAGAKAGMLAFKRSGGDVHHVGLVTEEGTVIHASSEYGEVVETALDGSWTLLGRHRLIGTREDEEMMEETGVVRTQGGRLNVRAVPGGEVIGQMDNGSEVKILGQEEGWIKIRWGEDAAYAAGAYIARTAAQEKKMRIVDAAGNTFEPVGAFTVEMAGND